LPAIAVTVGEPAGVGPEICLRLLERARQNAVWRTDRRPGRSLAARRGRSGTASLHPLARLGSVAAAASGTLDVLHLPLAAHAQAGRLDPANAPYVLALLDRALAGCQSGEFAAMVTAPVHKGVINDAGIPFTGHTEYLAERTGTPRVVMMLAGGGLRVALVTTHLPLKAVPNAVTRVALAETLRILHREMGQKVRHQPATHPGCRAQSARWRGGLSGP
jgi:4-hydroxythreonine-4-phosphate dehydrogenase